MRFGPVLPSMVTAAALHLEHPQEQGTTVTTITMVRGEGGGWKGVIPALQMWALRDGRKDTHKTGVVGTNLKVQSWQVDICLWKSGIFLIKSERFW